MTEKRVEIHDEKSEISDIFNDVGVAMQEQGLALGAIFFGKRRADGKLEFGLLMREDMPQNRRLELLQDLQAVLTATKESFQC